MTFSRVGSASIGSGSGATLTTTLPQTATAGNLLIATVNACASTATGPNPTCSTPAGWTLAATILANASNSRAGTFIFVKVATGGDSAPSFSMTYPSGGGIWTTEEWSSTTGWASSPVRSAGTGAANNSSSQTSVTLTDSLAVTAGDFVYSSVAVRPGASPTNLSHTWGGGNTVDVARQTLGSTVTGGTGDQAAASTTTIAPSVVCTMSSGTFSGAAMISVALKPATGSSGTADAPLGALTGSATGLRTRIGTAAAVLGTLAASGTGVRTHTTTAAAPLGSVTSSATSVRTHPATATATLGALASTATGQRTALGTAAAPFGSLTSAATSITPVNGTASAPLGGLASSGSGLRTTRGTAAAPLGVLVASATGVRTGRGTASAPLGPLAASAAPTRTLFRSATAPLGGLVGQATGSILHAITGTAAAPLGGLLASGTAPKSGAAAAPLGVLIGRAFRTAEPGVHRVGNAVVLARYQDPYDNTNTLPWLIDTTFAQPPKAGNLLTLTVVHLGPGLSSAPATSRHNWADGSHVDTSHEPWWLGGWSPTVTSDWLLGVEIFTWYKFADGLESVITFEVPGPGIFGDVEVLAVLNEWTGLEPAGIAFQPPVDFPTNGHGMTATSGASGTITSTGITVSNPDWVYAPIGGHVSAGAAAVTPLSPTYTADSQYAAGELFLAIDASMAATAGATVYPAAHFAVPGSNPMLAMGTLAFRLLEVGARAPLGGLSATAHGVGSHRGTATAPLGRLVAGQFAAGIAHASLGGVTAAARPSVRATATAPLGGLTSETVGRIATFAPGGGILTVTPSSSTFGATGRIVLGAVGVDTDGTIVSGVALNATSSWPSLALFDLLGRTKLGNLHPRGLTWRDPLDGAGVLKFDLPMDEVISGQAGGKRIVKAFMNGKARIAARIDAHTTELAVDDTVWRSFELAGALEMWNDGITLPEYGLKRASSQTRTFGPMSQADNWASRTPFVAASGFPFSEDTGRKKGKPAGLKSLNPWWIALTDPYDSQPPNEHQWFVKRFTNYAAFTWQMLAAADDYMSIWVDGEQVFSPDQANQQSWKYLAQIDGSFEPGPHVIAVEVVNSTFDNSHNPVALIMAIQRTNASGDPVKGAPFLITNDRWLVTDEISEWHHAEVLLTLVEEMTSAGVLAFQILRAGFSDTTDSDGEAFTDGGRPTIQIGQGVADVGLTFAETYFDLSVDATTMRVLVHKRLGIDRFATVRLKLGDVDDGGLIKHTIARREARQNFAIMQLADGTWTTREDTASVDEYGRAMIALSLGSTAATDSADAVADSQFNETAHPTRSITSETHTLVGPQPYRHYFKGDSIGVVNEDEDGYVKTRVVAINVDASGDDVVRAWPEVEEDRT